MVADADIGEFLTAAQACEVLGVKRPTLYSYVSRGRLRSYRQGMKRQRLYSRGELEKLAGVTPGVQNAVSLPKAEEWVGYV